MKILIEGEDYKTVDIETIIDARFYKEVGDTAIIDYVGYYYSFKNKEVVYILPKVFIDNNKKVLFEFDKLDLIQPSFGEKIQNTTKLAEFKYLLVLFYKSLVEYKNRYYSTSLLSQKDESIVLNSNIGNNEYSYLDIILNIVNFHKKNKNIILFVEKKHKSQQNKKASWQKTINKTIPFLDKNNQPIYMKYHNKKKYIDNEEQLLTIFYSVLNHIRKEYKFNLTIDNIYTIYTGKSYNKLMKDAPKILKKIKYKYFSDTFIKIYRLLEIYFSKIPYASINQKNSEFLMVNNYHIIFEDMIDKLFSDKLENNDLKKMKYQKDGKEIDHLFEYDSLLSKEESIFYVGDSKYYKANSKIGGNSIYKQFTYARNVIQFNIDLLHTGKSINPNIKYRDEVTEGYNITPNFFIEGRIYKDLNFDIDMIQANSDPNLSYHFKNRLFDRDTLFIQYYSINFLFVLKSYTIFNSFTIESFRDKSKNMFRDKSRLYLAEVFNFYEKSFDTEDKLIDFVEKYFKQYNGKIYRTKESPNILILATCKNNKEDKTISEKFTKVQI